MNTSELPHLDRHPGNDMAKIASTLRSLMRGEVISRDDTRYDEARSVWNALIDRRPAAIARCLGVADVITAVNFARTNKLDLAVRGGAHSVGGFGVCDGGLVIDLSAMRAVHVDPLRRRARVEGGATWGDVDHQTQAFGLAVPGGMVSTTGVAGLTLSGGIGWLRGMHGLSLDNLCSIEIVTANGDFLTADEEKNRDLFWAIRGGGGNFGVVTSFELKLHPIGPLVSLCAPYYPVKDARQVIRQWRDFMSSASGEIGSHVEYLKIPSNIHFPAETWGTEAIGVMALDAGHLQNGGERLNPLRKLGTPLTDLSGTLSYREVQSMFDNLKFNLKGAARHYWKSMYLDSLSDSIIDRFVDGWSGNVGSEGEISLYHFGGGFMRHSAESSAFGTRTNPFMLSIRSAWQDPTEDEQHIAWTRSFWREMLTFSKGGFYLNFSGLGEDTKDLVRDAVGSATFDRLVGIKTMYDPTNLFRLNQNILPMLR